MSHRGSILVLPSGIAAWPVDGLSGLAIEDLSPALVAEPPLDVLLLGTGREIGRIPEGIRARFRAAGISLDAMGTAPAIRTYNVLLAENRRVGAALIAVD